MLNLWRKKQRLLLFLTLLLGTQACFNEEDFVPNRIAGLKANPFYAVPLLHGTLRMENLLKQNESQYIEVDENQLIHLLYSDTLYSTSIRDHFLLPNPKLEGFYLSGVKTLIPGNTEVIVEERKYLDLGFNEARLDKIDLKAGALALSANSNIEEEVKVQLTFPTLQSNGQPFVFQLVLPAGSNSPVEAEEALQGFTIDLSEYELGDNRIPVDILATVTARNEAVILESNDYIQFTLNVQELGFSLIEGFFGEKEVSLPQNEVALSFFETLFSKGNFSLANPSLRFDFLNSNGVPLQIRKDILQARKKNGETLAITTDPANNFKINFPETPGKFAKTSVAITNVGEMVDMAPDFMDYKLTGRLNVGQPQSIVNFLTDNSQAGIVLHADIPLWGSVEGISLSDTLAMALQTEGSDLSGEGNTNVDVSEANASIRALIVNQFPLAAEVQVYFTDAQFSVTDSLFSEGPFLMQASQVNASGELQEAVTTKEDLPFTKDQLERLLEAKYMIVKGLLYTSRNADGSQPHVKIMANQQLEVKLGLKSSMNITVKK